MKLKVEYNETRTKVIDAEFPLFLSAGDVFDTGGWVEHHLRIEANGTEYSITKTERGWEFEAKTIDVGKSLGSMLREKDSYFRISTAEEFYEALNEFRSALARVPERSSAR